VAAAAAEGGVTFLSGLGARAWAVLAAVGAVLAAIGAAWVRGRRGGLESARARAAAAEQAARRAGDAAAADAERDGATDRLRTGRF